MLRSDRTISRRRGASAVEFAVVAPIFFMVVLGIIEFGRMAMVQQVITNAAREGARIAVLDGATAGKVQSRVEDYLRSGTIKVGNVKVSPDPPDSAGYGEPVSVTVTVLFNEVSWLPTPFMLGGITLQAEAVMRRETVE